MPPVAARPDHLELPPGNEEVRRRLVALARGGRLHHCLIFEGPQGVGKADSARWLAMLVNCQGPAELLGPRTAPCGACWACRNIARGQHPDVIELGLDPDKVTPIISVEQARELLGKLTLHPFNALQRFVIVDPADALTVEAANALLKTLEEPPTRTVFVLVSARPTDLLPTVRSRSQRVRFGPVALDRVVAWLEAQGIEGAEDLALLAEGCPARARALAEGGLLAWREDRDRLLEALDGGVPDRLAWAEAHGKGDRDEVHETVDRALDALGRLLRDALVRSAGGQAPLYNADRVEVVEDWAARLGAGGIARVQLALQECRRDLAANVNTRLALDALLASVAADLGPARPGGAP